MLLPLAAFLAVNVVVLVAVVLPLRESVAGMADERNRAYAALGAAKQAQADAERAAMSKRQASEGLQKFYDTILATDVASAVNAVRF